MMEVPKDADRKTDAASLTNRPPGSSCSSTEDVKESTSTADSSSADSNGQEVPPPAAGAHPLDETAGSKEPKRKAPEDKDGDKEEGSQPKKAKLGDSDKEELTGEAASKKNAEETKGEANADKADAHKWGIEQRLLKLLGQTAAGNSPALSDKSCDEDENPPAEDTNPSDMAEVDDTNPKDIQHRLMRLRQTGSGSNVSPVLSLKSSDEDEKQAAKDTNPPGVEDVVERPKEDEQTTPRPTAVATKGSPILSDDKSSDEDEKPEKTIDSTPPAMGEVDEKPKEDTLGGTTAASKAAAGEPSSHIPEMEPAKASSEQKVSAVAKDPSDAGDVAGKESEEITKVRLILEERNKAEQQDDTFMDGWYNWVSDLLDYHKKHGHCQIRDAESHALYNWLKRQRVMYRKGKLEPEKLTILQLMKTNGFETVQLEASKMHENSAPAGEPKTKSKKSPKVAKEKPSSERRPQRGTQQHQLSICGAGVGLGEQKVGESGVGMLSRARDQRDFRLTTSIDRNLGLHDPPSQLSMSHLQQHRMAPPDAPGAVLEVGREVADSPERARQALAQSNPLLAHRQASLLHFGAQEPHLLERARNQQALLLLLRQQQQRQQQQAQQQQQQQDMLLLQDMLRQYQRGPPNSDPGR